MVSEGLQFNFSKQLNNLNKKKINTRKHSQRANGNYSLRAYKLEIINITRELHSLCLSVPRWKAFHAEMMQGWWGFKADDDDAFADDAVFGVCNDHYFSNEVFDKNINFLSGVNEIIATLTFYICTEFLFL